MNKDYTPGPWTIHVWQNDPDGRGVTYQGEDNGVEKYTAPSMDPMFRIVADKKYLASSNTFGSFEGCHIADIKIAYSGFDEAAANAFLIASAPELLEAAQALLMKLDNMTTDQFSKGGEREERETLRAIIQKAMGDPDPESAGAPF